MVNSLILWFKQYKKPIAMTCLAMTAVEMIVLSALFLHRMTARDASPIETAARTEEGSEASSVDTRINAAEESVLRDFLEYLHDLQVDALSAGRSNANPVDPGLRRGRAAQKPPVGELAFYEVAEAILITDDP